MSDIIRIDFSKDCLLGYETPKYSEVVDSLIQAIRANITLPLFSVFQVWEHEYSLCPLTKIEIDWKLYVDGWHHRAIALFHEKWHTDAHIIEQPNIPHHMLQKGYVDIRKIPIVSSAAELRRRKERYWTYF